jgi:hypothetical protein
LMAFSSGKPKKNPNKHPLSLDPYDSTRSAKTTTPVTQIILGQPLAVVYYRYKGQRGEASSLIF